MVNLEKATGLKWIGSQVQCILVSKEASRCAEHLKELEEVTEDVKLKQLTMVSPGINGRMPRVSSRLRLCERYEFPPFNW